ncbi:MAG: hypothetical protein U0736_18865 [Gemmataceae bacterium]
MLQFERTGAGYKTRCPTCKAVVRLSIDTPPPPPPVPRKRDTDYVAAPLPDDRDPTAPIDLSVLSEHESSAPAAVVELVAYHDPELAPARSLLLLWLLALLGVVCVGLAITFVVYV